MLPQTLAVEVFHTLVQAVGCCNDFDFDSGSGSVVMDIEDQQLAVLSLDPYYPSGPSVDRR